MGLAYSRLGKEAEALDVMIPLTKRSDDTVLFQRVITLLKKQNR